MTFSTNRFNFKPILKFVTGMMILLCSIETIMALQEIRMKQFTTCNSVSYRIFGCDFFRVLFFIVIKGTFLAYLTLFALVITLSRSFALFCLVIPFFLFQTTDFAISIKSIIANLSFVKFRKLFSFFASSTGLCYNIFRHDRYSYNDHCSKPIVASYCNRLVLL